jgi:glycosyltransferase involved in cell wall biosynthesis
MNVSVVVPVYNSEESLPMLVERVAAVLVDHTDSFEVILVNDGSGDGSWNVISILADQHAWLTGINLARNYGQHNALLCGIRAASYEVIVTMDDDLQNPPEEIPVLLAELSPGIDVVYGAPESEQHGMLRNLASRFTKLALATAMGVETARKVSSFRAFRTNLRDSFSDFRGSAVAIDVLLGWGTDNFASTTVRHDSRSTGTSNYTVRRLVVHAFNLLTGYSVLPLQIASLLGFAFTVVGFSLLGFVVLRALLVGQQVQGFAFLASTITLFAGVQLFTLGIFGEYLARMHTRIMDRPTYVVRGEYPPEVRD